MYYKEYRVQRDRGTKGGEIQRQRRDIRSNAMNDVFLHRALYRSWSVCSPAHFSLVCSTRVMNVILFRYRNQWTQPVAGLSGVAVVAG